MSKPKITVEGIPGVNRALRQVGDTDWEKAGTEGARNLLPFIRAETRVETGRMQSGWEAEQSAFINEVDYAVYQEFGTESVEPAHAIEKSVDQHEDVLTKAFEDEVQDAANKAGLGR